MGLDVTETEDINPPPEHNNNPRHIPSELIARYNPTDNNWQQSYTRMDNI
jgi:hypothetical protein